MNPTDRAYLDNIGHPLFALDVGDDGVPRYCAFNQVARERLGRSEAEILGLTAAELYPGRLGQIALEHHIDVMHSGNETTYDLSLPLNDGCRRIRTTLRPQFDERGEVTRLFGSSTDITDH